MRHFYERVDRTNHDRLRERQHVRGEAHPLLRNLSNEDSNSVNATISSNTNFENQSISQSNTSLNNYCEICGQLTSHLDSHISANHPGCGMFWGSGICGHPVDGIYTLCTICKKKYSIKNEDASHLHKLAPDIIYNEHFIETDIPVAKIDIPKSQDCFIIQQLLGISEKVEGIPMER